MITFIGYLWSSYPRRETMDEARADWEYVIKNCKIPHHSLYEGISYYKRKLK